MLEISTQPKTYYIRDYKALLNVTHPYFSELYLCKLPNYITDFILSKICRVSTSVMFIHIEETYALLQ